MCRCISYIHLFYLGLPENIGLVNEDEISDKVYVSQQSGQDIPECLYANTDAGTKCRSLSYPLIEAAGRLRVVYVEWSPTPYTDCFLPGIDAAVRVSLQGIEIVGLPDELGNFPQFECSSDSRRINFVPFWTPYDEDKVVFKVLLISCSPMWWCPYWGPESRFHTLMYRLLTAYLVSTSSTCETLDVSLERVTFETSHKTLYEFTFTPVKVQMGEYIQTPIQSAGVCLYCKRNEVRIRDAMVNSSVIAAMAFINLKVYLTNVQNTGVAHPMANFIFVLGSERLEFQPNYPNVVEMGLIFIVLRPS